jgi:hypothetical protein
MSEKLNITYSTLQTHSAHISSKTGAFGLPALTKYSVKNGLASLDN